MKNLKKIIPLVVIMLFVAVVTFTSINEKIHEIDQKFAGLEK